ncbi:hypothetical protein ACIQUC_15285 [Curtobacterium sp. NPDC098951]|uniref:hypothetical protein n=1 Tax=Curtobacterium sp. NPDC098951 TaxID=3363974 RepID=UPI00381CDE2F
MPDSLCWRRAKHDGTTLLCAPGGENTKRLQITDDGETYAGVHCPWCGIDVENSEHLDVLDENDRSTTISADEFDHDHRTVSPDYDGRGQFDGLCCVCTGCDRPVSLPAAWTER